MHAGWEFGVPFVDETFYKCIHPGLNMILAIPLDHFRVLDLSFRGDLDQNRSLMSTSFRFPRQQDAAKEDGSI